MLHEPPILFLDEPTSGVDPISRRNFWELIYALAARGTTVFVTTHYMEEAEYCHRLALMNRGRLIALDTPAQPARRDAGEAARGADPGEPARRWRRSPELPAVIEAAMFGRRVHVTVARPRSRAPRRSRRRSPRAAIAFSGIEVVPPSLEDVFVSLIHAADAAGAPAGAPA